jgi:outer membrane protein OmpA-like peptidoglycan-associated protein
MKPMMRKIITKITAGICLGIPALSLPLAAQQIFGEQIPVKIQQLRQVDDSVRLDMNIDLSMLEMGTERSLLLTPVLIGAKGKSLKMKPLLINGHQRQKAFDRHLRLSRKKRQEKKDYYGVIELNKPNRKIHRYRQTLGFETWMNEARMEIVSDLCGCAGLEPQVASEKVADRIVLEGQQAYRALPHVAYLRPETEAVKSRNESNGVFLDFPVGQTEINPHYGNNPRELAKIESIIQELRNDANLQVTGVTITGFASPEGDMQMNSQLSRGRAEALRNYLSRRSGIAPHLYRTGNGGEDWNELARMVENSYIEPKGAILSIIRTSFGETRKERLKALGGGAVYRQLLHEYYPRLRRVVSRIDYTVRGFNVEEARQIIKVHPQQLSLNEMFLVANTYPEGSREFISVWETAVRVFPNDPVANLNAAAAALLTKDPAKAERYLQRAKKNTPAYYNNLGVLSMMQNNHTRAKNLFRRAAEDRLEAARKNLEELKKKEEADRLLTN